QCGVGIHGVAEGHGAEHLGREGGGDTGNGHRGLLIERRWRQWAAKPTDHPVTCAGRTVRVGASPRRTAMMSSTTASPMRWLVALVKAPMCGLKSVCGASWRGESVKGSCVKASAAYPRSLP